MNALTRFVAKLRPNMEAHQTLRDSAEETVRLAETVRHKREELDEKTEREFPMAGFLERERVNRR